VSNSFLSRDRSQDDANAAMLKRILPEYIQRLEKEGDTARSTSARGTLQEFLGQNDQALQSHLKAVELLEADRRRLRDERSRGTFLEDKMQVFYNAILNLLDRGRSVEAFDLVERSKSRAMADLLQTQELGLARPDDRRLYSESVQLTARISQLQSQLARYRSDGELSQNTEKIAGVEREIQRLEMENRKLQQAAGPRLQDLIVSKPVSLQALQGSMKEDRFDVLHYLVLPAQVVLWHIGSDTSNVCSVFLPREELIRKVGSLRKSMVDGASKFDQQTARELYLYLIQPALKWIKTDHLVIIPHDDLNYLPFQVLKDWATEQYLGEKFQISYAPSATILLRKKKAGSIRAGNLLAVADPDLEDARAEVQAIGALYPGRSKIVFDVGARESDVKAWVGSFDLIHLSVHGKFRADEPLLSYLQLNKSGSDDGMLTAAEMFGLPMEKAMLVVLSACETGQVAATHANEIIGMERALLFAGANSLILSSWAVDAASTKLWMETFYREAQSKPLSEAARLALITVKSRPEYNHPYHWAAFLLIGR
jgi:CHAT domain-containing protein